MKKLNNNLAYNHHPSQSIIMIYRNLDPPTHPIYIITPSQFVRWKGTFPQLSYLKTKKIALTVVFNKKITILIVILFL